MRHTYGYIKGDTAYYFLRDYLGSVRAVVAEDGTVEESSSYYPYGMQMPDETGSIQQTQPYKYGGKERLTAAGVNLYDFGPRALYSPAAQFTSMDPKCEDYPHLSPYLYCAANPANAIDPTGENYVVIKNENDSTYTVEAVYFVDEASEASAKSAVEVWNKLSGQAKYDGYKICFNLTVQVVDSQDPQLQTTKKNKFQDKVNISSSETKEYKYNSYEVKDDKTFNDYYQQEKKTYEVPYNVNGTTASKAFISVRENKSFSLTGAHEVGHTLGLLHSYSGLMNESELQRGSNIKVSNYELQLIVDRWIEREKRQ